MEADIIEEKREIRKRIRMKRESLSEEEVVTFSGEIAEHVIRHASLLKRLPAKNGIM